MPYLPSIPDAARTIGRRNFDFDAHVAVMAIINRTKDSFFDGGRTYDLAPAVDAALAAVAAGAEIIDIGGVPFSPDAYGATTKEEIDVVVPFVEALVARSDVAISVDTVRSQVAAAALDAGAAIVNDTSGLWDPDMAPLVAERGATIILTHSIAEPHVHWRKPHYEDVVAEVRAFLSDRVQRMLDAGARPDQLIVDPGPDLNKNTLHTLEICRRFEEFTTLGAPTLAALSNKDFIGETLDLPKEQRLTGTIAATTWCVERGARIVRVHDVPKAVETVRMTETLLGLRAPAYLRHNLD